MPGLVGAGIAIEKVRESAREAALRGLQESVRATALLIDGHVQRSIGALTALAHSTTLATGDLRAFYAEAQAVDQPPDVWTLLLDETGIQRLNTIVPFGAPPILSTAQQRVQTVLATGKPLVSDLIVGPVTKRLLTIVYVAAATPPAAPRYVVAQAFSVEHWRKMTLAPQGRDDWTVAVIDRNGKFISRNRRADVLLGQPARPELTAAAAAASEGLIRHRTLEGVDVYDAFAHSSLTGWTIAVAAPVESIEASATQAAVSLALGLLVALVAGAVSGTYLGRALLGAVAGASSSARSLAEGRVPPPATSSLTELNALQRSLTDAGRILAAERSGRTLAEDERTRLLVSEREARELAERQNAAKDRFLAMLGHELRNPLAAISGATEVLMRRGPAADDRRFVEIVQRQNRHLSHIVDDLLDTSRMLSGKVALKLKPIDLGAIVRECAESVRASHAAGVDLAVEAAEVWIDADAVRIEQTFNNLVANAIKFSPSGAPVRIEVRADGDHALLVVSDRGPGIAPSLLPNIFEPFVQGPSAPGRVQSGLGIGLALVKQIVSLHGGTVAVADNAGGPGCTFTVAFARVARPEFGAAEAPAEECGHGRVLLVEDNTDARDAVAALLRAQGFEVVEARDGEEALAAALEHRPDVVVMDLDMPGKSGLDVAREIRAHPQVRDLALVALSGHGQQSDKDETRRAGFDAHLLKPASPEALVAAIEAARERTGPREPAD